MRLLQRWVRMIAIFLLLFVGSLAFLLFGLYALAGLGMKHYVGD